MGKRRGNCEHDRLEILPGNVIVCQRCGERLEDDAIIDDVYGDPECGEMILIPPSCPKPLTHHIKGLT